MKSKLTKNKAYWPSREAFMLAYTWDCHTELPSNSIGPVSVKNLRVKRKMLGK